MQFDPDGMNGIPPSRTRMNVVPASIIGLTCIDQDHNKDIQIAMIGKKPCAWPQSLREWQMDGRWQAPIHK